MGLPALRLLIVEDEAVVARVLASTAREVGLSDVAVAGSAAAALEQAARRPPDVVLMDVSLEAKTSGLDAARELIARHRAAIIFLSGNPWLEQACLALPGHVQFLHKPFLRAELEAALARAEDGREAC